MTKSKKPSNFSGGKYKSRQKQETEARKARLAPKSEDVPKPPRVKHVRGVPRVARVEPPAGAVTSTAAPVTEAPGELAPLWDVPDNVDKDGNKAPLAIPKSQLHYTVVSRLVFDEKRGHVQPRHVGNVSPEATKDTIKSKWGGGEYLIQARSGQRLIAGRTLVIEGPEAGSQVFGPIGELPSGLVTLLGENREASLILSLAQIWVAQTREDCSRQIAMLHDLGRALATQQGAVQVVTHLELENKSLRERIQNLEAGRDDVLKDKHALELKREKDRHEFTWREALEFAADKGPSALGKLPPRFQKPIAKLLEWAAADPDETPSNGTNGHGPGTLGAALQGGNSQGNGGNGQGNGGASTSQKVVVQVVPRDRSPAPSAPPVQAATGTPEAK